MNEIRPVIALVRQEKTDKWKIELRDLRSFRTLLGPDVVNAFCRCFVHSDRLTSLISFGYLSDRYYGEPWPGFGRNLQTMVWFAVGTLRELALALRDLRSTLAKRSLLDPNSKPWITLRAVEDRWENNPFFRDMRHIVASHVDPEVMERGLLALEEEGNAILLRGAGGEARPILDETGARGLAQRHRQESRRFRAVHEGGQRRSRDFEHD